MRIALNTKGEQILASAKIRGEYICLDCYTEVVLAAGTVNVPHYRHKSLNACSYSNKADSINSMSAFHREIQEAFYRVGAELEKKYPHNRADVFYKNYVYEIQNSPIKYIDVIQRNLVYDKVRWIVNANTLDISHFEVNKLVFMVNTITKKIKLHYKDLIVFYVFKDYDELVKIVSDNKTLVTRINKSQLDKEIYEENKRKELEARRVIKEEQNKLRKEQEERSRLADIERSKVFKANEEKRLAEELIKAEAARIIWENGKEERERKANEEKIAKEIKLEMMYQSFLDDVDNPIRKVLLTPIEAYQKGLLNNTYIHLQ